MIAFVNRAKFNIIRLFKRLDFNDNPGWNVDGAAIRACEHFQSFDHLLFPLIGSLSMKKPRLVTGVFDAATKRNGALVWLAGISLLPASLNFLGCWPALSSAGAGSALLLALASALFLLSTLGAGLFLSTVSGTQQQAMMLAFFFIQPAFMLSGFTFPIRNMPQPVQWITLVNPLRYFMEIVRGVFLKGAGISVLWPQLLILGTMGVVILVSSALRFHKRLD